MSSSFGGPSIHKLYLCNRGRFLDVILHLVDGFIQTDVNSKPTVSHLYLSPFGAHPKHVFQAIPFGVASRLRRNCSEDFSPNNRLDEYKNYLIHQGYSAGLVNKEFTRTAKISINQKSEILKEFFLTFLPIIQIYHPSVA